MCDMSPVSDAHVHVIHSFQVRGSRTISPKKKPKREELSDKTALTPSIDENIVKKAAQLKRKVHVMLSDHI